MEDNNNIQTLQVNIEKCQTLKLMMKTFFDFYGRVIVYDLKILGKNI